MNNITHKGVFLSTERLITLNIDILDWHLLNTTSIDPHIHPEAEDQFSGATFTSTHKTKTIL